MWLLVGYFFLYIYIFYTYFCLSATYLFSHTANYWTSLSIFFSYYHTTPQLFFFSPQNWAINIKRYKTQYFCKANNLDSPPNYLFIWASQNLILFKNPRMFMLSNIWKAHDSNTWQNNFINRIQIHDQTHDSNI